ncbi:MAG: hypothetical protein LBJ01_06145 [Tannerella sp.]|jgi:hypothetical protein|nr:hypothetical protein [Tannerella sp.]
MERIQTAFSGITTSSVYRDGDCCELINLRLKNGALQPVAPRKHLQTLAGRYDTVFVHRSGDYENWLGTVQKTETAAAAVYWKIRDAKAVKITDISGRITGLEQIGNTVSIVTENSIYYLLFRDGDYVFLGELPEIPYLRLMSVDRSELVYPYPWEYGSPFSVQKFEEYTIALVNKAMDAYVNGANINADYKDDVHTIDETFILAPVGSALFDARLLRYAWRLYDGSLVKMSPPVLIMPRNNILDAKKTRYVVNNVQQIMGGYSSVTINGFYIIASRGSLLSPPPEWKELVRSLDIFMSLPLGVSNIENIRKDFSFNPLEGTHDCNLIAEVPESVLQHIENEGGFYLVHSVDYASVLSGTWSWTFPDTPDDMRLLGSLESRERLPNDPFSHHAAGAEKTYVYNSRLHLADISTAFFRGFSAGYFSWVYEYNGSAGPEINIPGKDLLVMEVEIEVGGLTKRLCSELSRPPIWYLDHRMILQSMLSYPDSRARRMTVHAVNQADPEEDWTELFSVPLKPHRSLNIAFYLDRDLGPPALQEGDAVPARVTDLPVRLRESSKLKVSELENPFVFPSLNVYRAGDGRILALATNAMPVSDQNYGQHPLFVFATDGVWTLNTGDGEAVYTTLSSPASEEVPVSDAVCETPFGVVFVSRRGLAMINSRSVEFISPQLEEEPPAISPEFPAAAEGVLKSPPKAFRDCLEGIERIVYNPYESELVVCDREPDFNYVYSLPGQMFYRSTEQIGTVAKNTYPELYVTERQTGQDGDLLKDFGHSETLLAGVALVLRPLRMGTGDVKKLDRMILRGLFIGLAGPVGGKRPLFMTLHSNDGVFFALTRGLFRNVGDHCRDIDMGLFARSKFRCFLFSFTASMDERSRIYMLESMIGREYGNEKMR